MASPNGEIINAKSDRHSSTGYDDEMADLDISVLFDTPIENSETNKYLMEMDITLLNLRKERELLANFAKCLVKRMENRISELIRESKVKDETIDLLKKESLQRERSLMDELNAFKEKLFEAENVHTISTVYWMELMKRIKQSCTDGEKFLNTMNYAKAQANLNVEGIQIVQHNSIEEPDEENNRIVISDGSDDGNNETVDSQPAQSNDPDAENEMAASTNDMNIDSIDSSNSAMTDDETNDDGKENAPPVSQQIEEKKQMKAGPKLYPCRFCESKFPKKILLIEHKVIDHKIKIKHQKELKIEHLVQKRKRSIEKVLTDDEEEESFHSSEPVNSLRIMNRPKFEIKSKKAKKGLYTQP